jgi:hypothetical protein
MLMEKKCEFDAAGSDGCAYRVEDWRKVIDTTTMHSVRFRSRALGNKPYLRLADGREVEWTGAGEFRIAATDIVLRSDDPQAPQGIPHWA